MTITEGIIIALFALISAVITASLAARNTRRQLETERERIGREEDAKREALLASVHREASDSARTMYKELCTEQQARIMQQHEGLSQLNNQVGTLRGEMGETQDQLEAARAEMLTTQNELAKTRLELQSTRDELVRIREELHETRELLRGTKGELTAARNRQKQLEDECEALRARVLLLEAELARYKAGG